MARDLSASQARAVSTTDLVIYNEIDVIYREIIAQSLAGNLSATISDDSLMTESTPKIVVTGSTYGSGFTDGQTIVINGTTVTLNSDGGNTNIYQAYGSIVDANVPGIEVSIVDGALVLTYEPSQTNWSFTLAEGNGTALADIGFTPGTYTASNPKSIDYYNVWSGQTDDRKMSYELAQVSQHLQNLGYNVVLKQNPTTSNTLMWEVYW